MALWPVLWKKTTKLNFCRRRASILFDLVAEVRVIIVAAFEGYFCKTFVGRIVPDLFKRRLIADKIDKLLRTNAHIGIEMPLQLPDGGEILIGLGIHIDLSLAALYVGYQRRN